MLTSFEVINAAGDSQSFTPSSLANGYQVRNIEGLDPVRANVVSTNFANTDGEQYQSSRREKRNIILTLGLIADYSNTSVSDLRNNLYQYFMPKSPISLKFHRSDGPSVEIDGRVETFDSPIFTSDPTVSISVVCFDPDFKTAEDNKIITLRSTTSPEPIEYSGSVTTGLEFELNVTAPITDIQIRTQSGNDIKTMDLSGSLLVGDILRISTTPGRKFVMLTRAGDERSFLSALNPYSVWATLEPGTNTIAISGGTSTNQSVTVRYLTRVGGL